jgi:Ser/Thr protein kinase RdoA (MazF antagonist)
MVLYERQAFKANKIFDALSQLDISGGPPCLDSEFRGGQCHIFKVSFQDAASFAVRVPLYMGNAGGLDAKTEALQTEMQNLQVLETKGFPWSPRCRGHSLTFDNAVQHPFLVLTWVDGKQLSWDDDSPPREVRDKVLGQMASIQLALIECTLEKGSTATVALFERLAKNRRARVKEGKIPGLSLQDCADQRAFLDALLGEDRDDMTLAMDHGDFKPDNVIVDANYNIQGYV